MGANEEVLKRILGYDMGANGEFVVNEKQALVAKAMFARAVLGFPYSDSATVEPVGDVGDLNANRERF
ncbi:hypothetical protein RV04_GL001485 [Enterococcus hermanniensis]|uniref:Uncharacterized protein n=1 Tax=Enterococcus hermanniensis TaxID=249189 RepID=A0A1L8TPR5_9ENTE|nr:hypothetical protein RV04_GL001485 [Enterococcus hermanniensis]